jgi:hypothetical protein
MLTGLAASTTYHFRLVAVNEDGTSYGPDGSFTTPASSGSGGPAPGPSGQSSGDGTTSPTGGATRSGSNVAGADPAGGTVVSVPPLGAGATSRTATAPRLARLPVSRVKIGAHRARVRLNCSTRCSGTLVLRSSRGVVLGRVTINLRGRHWVTVRLGSTARRALAATARSRTVTVQLLTRGVLVAAAVVRA